MQTHLHCESCAGSVRVEGEPGGRALCPGCGIAMAIPHASEVFVSYERKDAGATARITAALGAAGIRYWLDTDRLSVSDFFGREIALALTEARILLVILSRRSVQSRWVRKEVTHATSQGCSIFPLLIEDFELPPEWSFLLSDHQYERISPDELANGCRRVVDRVHEELQRLAAGADEPEAEEPLAREPESRPLRGVDPGRSPYQGPRPFPHRARHFYGRDVEATQLLEAIARSRVVLVYAPSGAGKSSLLNTVIADRLEENSYDVILGARVGGALPPNLKLDEIRNIYAYAAVCGIERVGAPEVRTGLSDYLRSIRQKRWARRRIVIFDQFEELFTRHDDRWEDRAGFFDDLANAIAEDETLRVVLAIRQEYLANVKEMEERLPPGLRPQHFALRRIEEAGALAAITKPAADQAEFAPGVAEEIVRELGTIRTTRADGEPVSKRAEYIEMVHLQVVCDRLWKNLPRGITRIEREHVVAAAGGGEDVAGFVNNAVESFFDNTVREVAESTEYDEELIRFGCLKFVTPTMTRTLVQQSNARVGRLPEAIARQLEASHLVRAEERGGERWYELSHDLLAAPVGRLLDRNVSKLLFATDLLARVLENAREGRGGSLQGYFSEHRDVLAECAPFHRVVGLFPDEAAFVFRASIAAGRDTVEWSERLAHDAPEERIAVLRDACLNEDPKVRRNVGRLLGRHAAPELDGELVRLALADEDVSVRQAAAVGLARLDRPGLYQRLVERARDAEGRSRAIEALAVIRIQADNVVEAPLFEHLFASLDGALRRRVRARARRIRLREGLVPLAFAVLPAGGFAALSAGVIKALPASLNWAVPQATASPAMGAFHGLTAGILWAGIITLAIGLYHEVLGRDLGRRATFRPMGALAAGTLGGIVSSLVVVGVILLVFTSDTLQTMGWLTGPRTGLGFWKDVFVEARFGWVHIVTGTGIGLGMALTINRVRAAESWRRLRGVREPVSSASEVAGLVRRISRIVLPNYWPIPVAIGLAAAVAFFIPATQPLDCSVMPGGCSLFPIPPEMNDTAPGLALGLFGDWLTQSFGAYFGMVGFFLGTLAWRRGFRLTSQDPA